MRVAVIGAGVGGLCVGARLAKAGLRVDVLDAAVRPGGKMYAYTNAGGVEWDTGPTLLTLPDEIRDTCDELFDSGLSAPTLLPLSHGTHVHFADGVDWQLPPGPALASYLSGIDTVLAKQCAEVLGVASDIFAFAAREVLRAEPRNIVSLGLRTLASGLATRHPDLARSTYKEFVDARITHPHMRELFYHFCSYVGMWPAYAQASLVSIAHAEMTLPVVFPRGGMHAIARYLAEAAVHHGADLQQGVRVRAATPVGAELRNGGWDVAVEGEDRPRRYDVMVVATDPHQALVDWLDAPALRRAWYGDIVEGRLAPGESQFVVLFEREETSPLAHHVKVFPKSFLASYREVLLERRVPEDPCVYLVWPHATDKTVPPEVLFVSAMAPSLDSGHSWDEDQCESYARTVMELTRRRLDRSLPGRVVRTVSPMELYRRTGALRGGLYGATPTRHRASFFARPSHERTPHLYFVGGGVHPGAGVPMVMMGAKRVARTILEREGK